MRFFKCASLEKSISCNISLMSFNVIRPSYMTNGKFFSSLRRKSLSPANHFFNSISFSTSDISACLSIFFRVPRGVFRLTTLKTFPIGAVNGNLILSSVVSSKSLRVFVLSHSRQQTVDIVLVLQIGVEQFQFKQAVVISPHCFIMFIDNGLKCFRR